MACQRFSLESIAPVSWKNGGGSTCELACWPPDAGMDSFDWRVSIATINAAGPFSVFAGIDRIITLLDGAGVHLRTRDGCVDHRLDTPLVPFPFSGDVVLDATPLGGASTDFNVMVRRGRLRAALHVCHDACALSPCPHGLLLARHGHWRVDGLPPHSAQAAALTPSQGLWWADSDAVPCLCPDDTPGTSLLAVLIHNDWIP
ncbi:MAG: HutD family protein [Burkholderiaceae bacterium]|jgi:environmental stress-induced protein Ves|nr:HutD family protein [Burkholderiaceae bacterium]